MTPHPRTVSIVTEIENLARANATRYLQRWNPDLTWDKLSERGKRTWRNGARREISARLDAEP